MKEREREREREERDRERSYLAPAATADISDVAAGEIAFAPPHVAKAAIKRNATFPFSLFFHPFNPAFCTRKE
jgi:hypothetical protein